MIPYAPKKIFKEVNAPSSSFFKEFIELVIKITGVLVVCYIILGLLVDYAIVPNISPAMEERMGKLFLGKLQDKAPSPQEQEIQIILDNLVKNASALPRLNYDIYIDPSKQVNAIALPGGHIVLLSALLDEVDSENELAMILGHELGHFAHRDHLRGLGRNLVFILLSTIFLGTDHSTGNFLAKSIMGAEMKFSQAQEKAADQYGLELLEKTYGHAAGAVDFFDRIAQKEKMGKMFYILASHPNPAKRSEILRAIIVEKKYNIGQKKPFRRSHFAL